MIFAFKMQNNRQSSQHVAASDILKKSSLDRKDLKFSLLIVNFSVTAIYPFSSSYKALLNSVLI